MGTERVLIAGGGIADLSLDLAQRGGHLLLDALTRKLSNLNDQQRDERQNAEVPACGPGHIPGRPAWGGGVACMGKPPIPPPAQRPYRLHHTHLWHGGGSPAMDQICLVVPVLPGRTADARDFMRELEASRNAGYQASEQRIGIVKEAWYLARTPAGDQLVAYLESPDVPAAFSARSQSHDEFDQWFKRRLADATGLDLNTPPTAPLPELLSSYPANDRY